VGVFKPKLSSGENKSDATTKVVQRILEEEKTLRDKKTERLRMSRMAYEQAHPSATPEKKKARPGKRRAGTAD
jgi:hypothetical protein